MAMTALRPVAASATVMTFWELKGSNPVVSFTPPTLGDSVGVV